MKTTFDINGKKIVIGEFVIMPEPNEDDIYTFGGWVRHVTDILDNGMLMRIETNFST